jgi:hypothetical protein
MNNHKPFKKDAILYSSYLQLFVSAVALFILLMVYLPTFDIIQHRMRDSSVNDEAETV